MVKIIFIFSLVYFMTQKYLRLGYLCFMSVCKSAFDTNHLCPFLDQHFYRLPLLSIIYVYFLTLNFLPIISTHLKIYIYLFIYQFLLLVIYYTWFVTIIYVHFSTSLPVTYVHFQGSQCCVTYHLCSFLDPPSTMDGDHSDRTREEDDCIDEDARHICCLPHRNKVHNQCSGVFSKMSTKII